MSLDLPADFDVAAAIAPSLQPSRRTDGWTAARQRGFCEALATGASVENAARTQGLSPSSAYSFRNAAKGAAFAVGWTAAQLLQRQRLADTVAARAFDGQTITITRPDGATHERHFYDNRLAMNVLARLDRLAAGQVAAGVPDTTGEGQAARLAAAEFDRYLDVLGQGDEGAPARPGLFLAARAQTAPGAPELAALSSLARADLYARTGAGVPAELDVSDLDPAARAGWTAGQWARAEAAGLVVLAPAPALTADDEGEPPHSQHWDHEWEDEDEEEEEEEREQPKGPVWWSHLFKRWLTAFPPPVGFDGDEFQCFGDAAYQRSLTAEEAAAMPDTPDATPDPAVMRDRWFAVAAAARQAEPAAPSPDADPPLCDWPPAAHREQPGDDLTEEWAAHSSPHPGEGRGPVTLPYTAAAQTAAPPA